MCLRSHSLMAASREPVHVCVVTGMRCVLGAGVGVLLVLGACC